ncbi:hypothetical protein Q0Z83_059810 [Actinoplanes sichuanensis]|uniref:Uncharacterized protein n=1 Tax=Actinoplanes sichuanensis TaxID=512349 RepID=A0ABW4A6H8_9ACTN|nr:hypothetical protein [Actinoplanes sichuanensis]BEL07790.1 hypothetical protein Q0Z83_059810 [Actinoplanes sichuanensis]
MTKHTCNGGRGPAFGKKTPGCPRCDELLGGAAPRQLGWVERKRRRESDEQLSREALNDHFNSAGHRSGRCGPVCTFGDW